MRKTLLKELSPDRLIDLKVDYAFKQLFGNENYKTITLDFLNAVLDRTPETAIQDITFMNTETGGEHLMDKQSRLDLLISTADGETINVEIQYTNKYDMVKRSLYYWSDIFRSRLSTGDSYKELQPVITISILNFILLPHYPGFHTTCRIHETKGLTVFTEELEMHFIEIPKLLQEWENGRLNPQEDALVMWLLLIGMVDKRSGKVYMDIYNVLEEIAMNEPNLHHAFENWEALSATPEEREAFRVRWKQMMDEQSARREAELREKEKLEQGLEKGLEKGKELGDHAARMDIAKQLLDKRFELPLIIQITELTREEILSIQSAAE